MNRRYRLHLALFAMLTSGLALAADPSGAELLRAVRVKDHGHLADLQATFWKQAPAATVAMLPQVIAVPMQPTPLSRRSA